MAGNDKLEIEPNSADKYRVRHGKLNGEAVRVFASGGIHPITKEWFPVIVERERDFAIIGLR